MGRTYQERRAVLSGLGLEGPRVRTPPYWTSPVDPEQLLDAVVRQGGEGLVSKRLDSAYIPGVRSRSWVKTVARLRVEALVVGYLEGRGAYAGSIGSLVLAGRRQGELRWIGCVGTGFTLVARRAIRATLDRLARPDCPLAGVVPDAVAMARWARPVVVVDVEVREFTEQGRLRHPSFVGVRGDRRPEEVGWPEKSWQPVG